MSQYQFKFVHLDRERRKALSGRDAVRYFSLCEESGIEPEDKALYDSGRAEELSDLERICPVEEKINGPDYSGFLKKARSEGVEVGNFSANPIFKRKSLIDYFPRRFGKDAKQDLSNCTDFQVGIIYQGVLATAKKNFSGK